MVVWNRVKPKPTLVAAALLLWASKAGFGEYAPELSKKNDKSEFDKVVHGTIISYGK